MRVLATILVSPVLAAILVVLLSGCAHEESRTIDSSAREDIIVLKDKISSLEMRISKLDKKQIFDHVNDEIRSAYAELEQIKGELTDESLRLHGLKEQEQKLRKHK